MHLQRVNCYDSDIHNGNPLVNSSDLCVILLRIHASDGLGQFDDDQAVRTVVFGREICGFQQPINLLTGKPSAGRGSVSDTKNDYLSLRTIVCTQHTITHFVAAC